VHINKTCRPILFTIVIEPIKGCFLSCRLDDAESHFVSGFCDAIRECTVQQSNGKEVSKRALNVDMDEVVKLMQRLSVTVSLCAWNVFIDPYYYYTFINVCFCFTRGVYELFHRPIVYSYQDLITSFNCLMPFIYIFYYINNSIIIHSKEITEKLKYEMTPR